MQVRASVTRWEGAESAQEKPGLQRDDAPSGDFGSVTIGLYCHAVKLVLFNRDWSFHSFGNSVSGVWFGREFPYF